MNALPWEDCLDAKRPYDFIALFWKARTFIFPFSAFSWTLTRPLNLSRWLF